MRLSVIWIGAGACAVAVAIVAGAYGYFLYFSKPKWVHSTASPMPIVQPVVPATVPPNAPWKLSYIPANASWVLGMRPAAILNAATAKELIARLPTASSGLQRLEQDLGVSLNAFEQIVITGQMPSPADVRFLVVVHSTIPLDDSKVIGAQHRPNKVDYEGQSYYRAGPSSVTAPPSPSGGQPPVPSYPGRPNNSLLETALWMPDARTVVFGSEPLIKQAITQAQGSRPTALDPSLTSMLDEFGTDPHVVVVVKATSIIWLAQTGLAAGLQAPDSPLSDLSRLLGKSDERQALAGAVTVTEDIALAGVVYCGDDSAAASQLRAAFQERINRNKELVAVQRAAQEASSIPQTPGIPQGQQAQQQGEVSLQAIAALEDMLNGTSVELDAGTVRVTSRMSGSGVATLIQDAIAAFAETGSSQGQPGFPSSGPGAMPFNPSPSVPPSDATGEQLRLQPIDSNVAMTERRLLDGRVTMLIPTDFELMNEAMLRSKYPSEQRPAVVYTNESGTVNLALNHTQDQMPAAQLLQFHKATESTFKRLYPSAKWFQSDRGTINGREFFILDLRTPAIDTQVRNVMVATSCQGRMLIISFNVVEELETEWLAAGNKAMMSIRVSE